MSGRPAAGRLTAVRVSHSAVARVFTGRRRTQIESTVLEWIQAHREQALLLVPLLAFAEACIGVGLFISGLFLVVVGSFVLAQGIAPLPLIVALAFAGALLGDHTGYYVGRWLGPRVHDWGFVKRHRARLDRAKDMIRRRGAGAILIGRFIPAIRSLIPAALGIGGFDRLRYSLVDLVACSLWAGGLALILGGVARF